MDTPYIHTLYIIREKMEVCLFHLSSLTDIQDGNLQLRQYVVNIQSLL